MRRVAIVIAVIAAATLGFAGSASAQSAEDLRPVCNDVIGAVAEGTAGTPIQHTTAGAQESCNESLDQTKVVVGPLLCGLATDLRATPLAPVGDGVDTVRESLENSPLNNATPIGPDFTGCGDDGNNNPPPPNVQPTSGGTAPTGGAPQVLSANATADGSLPRTGGELFAGAGFALMSLGALMRRLLP